MQKAVLAALRRFSHPLFLMINKVAIEYHQSIHVVQTYWDIVIALSLPVHSVTDPALDPLGSKFFA